MENSTRYYNIWKVLYLDYYADTPSFSKILPTALKMINSLRINSSAIAELKPPFSLSSSPPSSSNNAATSPSVTPPTYTKGHHGEAISIGSFSLPPAFSSSSSDEDEKESNEPDYDEDQLEEKQGKLKKRQPPR
jgi:hypothetical protein